MKVIFMRHAQGNHNLNNIINQDPKINVDLTKFGEKQAFDASQKLKNEQIDVIFVSEFLRTRRTAEIFNGDRDIPIQVDKRINEFRVGFEGKTVEEYNSLALKDPLNFKLKGKESWLEMKKRVGKFISDLKKKKYSCVLVISHESILQAAMSVLGTNSDEKARFVKFGNGEFFSVYI